MSKKIYIPAEFKSVLEFLKNNIVFDFVYGPYIVGSSVTTTVEKLFRQVEYIPEDIDIICRTSAQREKIMQKLSENYNIFTRPQMPVCIGVDLPTIDLCAADYLRSYSPYTVNSVADCSELLLFSFDLLKDVKKAKLVKLKGNNFILKKFKKRGYSE